MVMDLHREKLLTYAPINVKPQGWGEAGLGGGFDERNLPV